MDTELQAALRVIGRGFHGGRFGTVELLKAIGINQIYLATGVFSGVFLRLEEIEDAIETFGIGFYSEEAAEVKAWIADPARKALFMKSLREPRNWVHKPWEDGEGGAYLHIRVLDLNSKELNCCGNPPNTHLAGFMMMRDKCVCGNNRCIGHVIDCSICSEMRCVACISIEENDNGDTIKCFECEDQTKVVDASAAN